METLKEVKHRLNFEQHNEVCEAYYDWYKTAIKCMLWDIQNTEVTSVETIEKWLNNILNK